MEFDHSSTPCSSAKRMQNAEGDMGIENFPERGPHPANTSQIASQSAQTSEKAPRRTTLQGGFLDGFLMIAIHATICRVIQRQVRGDLPLTKSGNVAILPAKLGQNVSSFERRRSDTLIWAKTLAHKGYFRPLMIASQLHSRAEFGVESGICGK